MSEYGEWADGPPKKRGKGWKRIAPYRVTTATEFDALAPGEVRRVAVGRGLVLTVRREANGTFTVFSRFGLPSSALDGVRAAECGLRGADQPKSNL